MQEELSKYESQMKIAGRNPIFSPLSTKAVNKKKFHEHLPVTETMNAANIIYCII